MVRVPAKVTNERREQVWFLMLKGNNPQSIIKALGTTRAVVYNDIKFLTNKSKQYIYDLGKGLHVLAYTRAIEGISLALSAQGSREAEVRLSETNERMQRIYNATNVKWPLSFGNRRS